MKRILVIDDEADIREVILMTLEMTRDWRISLAASGSEGLVVAAREQPDVILLDVMMPNMDGPTTFTKLQTDHRTHQIPVLMLTAKVQSVDQMRFSNLGVAGVIAKPFNPLHLADRIEAVLGWTDPQP